MKKNAMRPIHPGEILREEYMVPMGLSANALDRALGVTPARINDIARERRGITGDTALRLARYIGTDAQSWLDLQTAYDLRSAEIKRDCASKCRVGRLLWRGVESAESTRGSRHDVQSGMRT